MEGSQQAKVWLVSSEDLLTMYRAYKNGGTITLWCDGSTQEVCPSGQGLKRKRDGGETGTKRQDKEEEVDGVYKQLSKKHTEMENTKLRLWARMICGGLHDDYDEPPDIPAFNPKKKQKKDDLSDALSGAATAICKALTSPSAGESSVSQSGISPSKTVNLRMKSYEQLRYLKKLHEDGIIEEEEYCEQKDNIMITLRKLS